MLSCIRNITLRTIKKPEGTNVPIVNKKSVLHCLQLCGVAERLRRLNGLAGRADDLSQSFSLKFSNPAVSLREFTIWKQDILLIEESVIMQNIEKIELLFRGGEYFFLLPGLSFRQL